MFRTAIVLCLFAAVAYGVDTCEEMAPFCTDDGIQQFAAGVGSIAQDGIDYGCLNSRPNPAWYYMLIDDSGDLEIGISSQDGEDVDFALWGPFSSYDNAVASCPNFGLGSPIDCSWDSAPSEQANIDFANNGEVYVLVITNYADKENSIIFAKNSGAATTDCSVLKSCDFEPELTEAYAETNCAGSGPNEQCPIFAAVGYRATVELGSAVCSSGVWEWEWFTQLSTASVDIDEAAEGSCVCGSNTFCSNTIGSFECFCLTGFESFDGVDCVDIDECSTGANNCGTNSICTNTVGSFECSCMVGYEPMSPMGSNYDCVDINECADMYMCPENSDCLNTDGAYECYCHVGYDGEECLDIDECATMMDDCNMYADCMNTVGSFTCECWMGYSGDGVEECIEDYVAPSPSASAEPVETDDCVEEVVSEVNVIFAYIFRGLRVEPDCEDEMM